MKNTIKKIVPSSLLKIFRKQREINQLNKLYNFDKKRYKKSTLDFSNKYTKKNLRSKITFHYHSIEKGLSNAHLRLGFGEKAFRELFFAMDKYLELGYPTNDYRFQSAISAIYSYIKLHKENDFSVDQVENKFYEYAPLLIDEYMNDSGYFKFQKDDLLDYEDENFKNLMENRYSIRDFGTKEIDDNKILNSIQIATKSPSVCNRQSSHVYLIKNQEKLSKALEIQGGLRGNGNNLKKILLITADKEYMNLSKERNQTYIDGGIFVASLLYSLTFNNIATCTLNADFSYKKEIHMRDLLGIKDSEDIISMIAVGSYPEEIKVAKSPRENAASISTVV